MTAFTGQLQDNTITLDAPVPSLDGHRVLVTIMPADEEVAPSGNAEDVELSADDQARLWEDWVRQGPQGPIEP